MISQPSGALLTQSVARRQEEIAERLSSVDRDGLLNASRLPGWDRLTIVCHLRYGAPASRRMTVETLAGTETAYYPEGRGHQRPMTLHPHAGETERDAIAAFKRESHELSKIWAHLADRQWQMVIHEPPDNEDLGSISLWTLALLRLTEVEVHGHDLDLGLTPWSDTFVDTALPMRLAWLPTRRSNHQPVDQSINGKWALAVADGPTYLVKASGANVEVTDAENAAGADATIAGTAHQLLAFMLGRTSMADLNVQGDSALAGSFLKAFPAPQTPIRRRAQTTNSALSALVELLVIVRPEVGDAVASGRGRDQEIIEVGTLRWSS